MNVRATNGAATAGSGGVWWGAAARSAAGGHAGHFFQPLLAAGVFAEVLRAPRKAVQCGDECGAGMRFEPPGREVLIAVKAGADIAPGALHIARHCGAFLGNARFHARLC